MNPYEAAGVRQGLQLFIILVAEARFHGWGPEREGEGPVTRPLPFAFLGGFWLFRL